MVIAVLQCNHQEENYHCFEYIIVSALFFLLSFTFNIQIRSNDKVAELLLFPSMVILFHAFYLSFETVWLNSWSDIQHEIWYDWMNE